ncbi:tetratricopeptide repeat protein, partial [Escherichia coli]|nr:tetratricopeptide repeat protein [Escherichia coli]
AWAEAGNPEQARAVMKEMVGEGLTPSVVSYNTLMKAWANVGNPEKVRAVMKDMVGEGHTPGVVSYNSLMNAWAEAGNPEQARAVIKEMVGEGFTPDVVCYNTLMKAWANVGNPEQARAVMEEMVRAGVTPNLHSYGMLIDSWVKADIPLFATNNGYHNYILPLIKNAIDDGVLGDTVGYDKHRNIIDLHLPAVCLSQNKNGGVSFNLGRAVVDFHYHEGNLKDNPSFIVGYHEHRCHSRSVLSEAVLSELHALSSNYGDMFNYVVEPRNPGRLCRK